MQEDDYSEEFNETSSIDDFNLKILLDNIQESLDKKRNEQRFEEVVRYQSIRSIRSD